MKENVLGTRLVCPLSTGFELQASLPKFMVNLSVRCGIAEKSLHIICVSLNNRTVHCIMPRSLKEEFLTFRNPAPY